MKYHLSNFFLRGLAAGIRKLCGVWAHGTCLLGSSSCSQQGCSDLSAAPGTCTRSVRQQAEICFFYCFGTNWNVCFHSAGMLSSTGERGGEEVAHWEPQGCMQGLCQGEGTCSISPLHVLVPITGNHTLDKMYLLQTCSPWLCPICSCGSCDEIPEMQIGLCNSHKPRLKSLKQALCRHRITVIFVLFIALGFLCCSTAFESLAYIASMNGQSLPKMSVVSGPDSCSNVIAAESFKMSVYVE